MIDYEKMMTHVKSHPFPLVFATISGAHLYGFPRLTLTLICVVFIYCLSRR